VIQQPSIPTPAIGKKEVGVVDVGVGSRAAVFIDDEQFDSNEPQRFAVCVVAFRVGVSRSHLMFVDAAGTPVFGPCSIGIAGVPEGEDRDKAEYDREHRENRNAPSLHRSSLARKTRT